MTPAAEPDAEHPATEMPTRPLTERWDLVDGRRWRVLVGGPPDAAPDTLPVVLVHGYAMSAAYMTPLGERLAAHRPVLVPELPGHGGSDEHREVTGVEAAAAALDRWMHLEGIPRAALVGNSLGAQVVLAVAERHPARAAAAVLVGPTTPPGLRRTWALVGNLLRDVPTERASLVPVAVRAYLGTGPRRLLRELRALREDRPELRLAAVRAHGVPALVVRGARDPLVPARWGRRLATGLGADEVVVPGAGHAVHHSRPDVVAAEIERFLRRVERGMAAEHAARRDHA